MKIAIIGAGSTYTPELIEGFIEYREKMPFQEISLMDRDPSRLNIIGDFAGRMLRRAGMEKLLHITTDLEEALSDAAFVMTQIRVGGSRGRLLDEEIAREFGLVAQETTGVGGFSHALRAIPQMLEIARIVECFCPQAWVINFTNPSGIITEALANYSSVKVIGLCNVPLVMRRDIAAALGVQAENLKIDSFGLNHLSWIKRILLGETDLTAAALEEIEKVEILKKMDSRLIRKLNLIPSPYLRYYYQTDSVLKEQETETLRAQKVMEIEQSLLRLYAGPDLDKKPPMLSERGGALYSVAALGLMASLLGTEPVVHTVNVQNRGAIADIRRNSVVEIPAEISSRGAESLPFGALPPSVAPLIRSVKNYEDLTIQAAVEGSAVLAAEALTAHPLVAREETAWSLLARILEVHGDFLPAGFNKGLKKT